MHYMYCDCNGVCVCVYNSIGRGTATMEGLAIAEAIIEYLHNKIGINLFVVCVYGRERETGEEGEG